MTEAPVRSCLMLFSGGKDSMLALHRIREAGYEVRALAVLMLKEPGLSLRHGFSEAVLRAYEAALGIPLCPLPIGSETEEEITEALCALQQKFSCRFYATGDIDVPASREMQERIARSCGLQPLFPLWNMPRTDCVREFLRLGYRCVIHSMANPSMPSTFLGRELNEDTMAELTVLGVDPSGEDNSFHTLVLDGPLFLHPLRVISVGKSEHNELRLLHTLAL